MFDKRRFLMRFTVAVAVLVAALMAKPAVALPGLSVVSATSVWPITGQFRTATATCPFGSLVIGGGAHGSPAGALRIEGMGLDTSRRSVLASGIANTVGGSFTSFAICAPPPAGYEVVQADDAPPAGAVLAQRTVFCPAGKTVIGAGASSAGKPGYVLEGARIFADLSAVYVRTARTRNALLGTAPFARAFAICINPIPLQQWVTASSAFGVGSFKSVTLTCPAGTRLHGLTGLINNADPVGDSGRAGIESLRPIGSGSTSGASFTARLLPGTADNKSWGLELIGVCAQ